MASAMTIKGIRNNMRHMKYLLILIGLIGSISFAQQLAWPLPTDGNRNPLYFGTGNPYGFVLTATTDAFDTGVRYELPSAGIDLNRVYRHISVINPSSERTLYICFGDVSGCSTDMIIVPPSYQLVYEPLMYGPLRNTGYVYMRLDDAGSVEATFGVW